MEGRKKLGCEEPAVLFRALVHHWKSQSTINENDHEYFDSLSSNDVPSVSQIRSANDLTYIFSIVRSYSAKTTMPFSHHSHSGQFCPGHAQDALEDVIKTAISKGFHVFALTEHMPRHDQDLYPEEVEAGSTFESLTQNENDYVKTALELREKYKDRIALPLGFESDWCGQHSLELIERSIRTHPFDFFMGSIHHVAGVPIDFDQAGYDRARELAGGTDEKLFERYFDEQLDMLQATRPPVVGHFDLIRLKSGDFNTDWRSMSDVWTKILRNLDFVASYGGILEINTAALRKGMAEPYPKSEICQVRAVHDSKNH